MPIEIAETIRVFDQKQFGEIAFEVMECAFRVHNELGRFFDEEAYQRELLHDLGSRASDEVWIRARHGDCCKPYRIDLLVDQGPIFELKVVEAIADEHRSQLLNYLLLSETRHGKLINFRTPQVQHDFVNTTLTHSDRTTFDVEDSSLDKDCAEAIEVRDFFVEVLRD